MKRISGFFPKSFLVAVSVFLSSAVHAGTELHFRSGTVHLNTAAMEGLAHSTVETDYIIQFASAIQPSDQVLLKSNNIRILRYIPDDAYIVRARGDVIHMALDGRLSAVAVFEKSWKLAPALAQGLAAQPFQALQVTEVRHPFDIMTFTDADGKKIEKVLRSRQGFENVERDGRFLRTTARLQDVAKIAELSGVENIEARPVIETMDMNFGEDLSVGMTATPGDYTDLKGYESGTKLLNFDSVWAQGFNGSGQIASMADTGLDMGAVGKLAPDFQTAVQDGFVAGIGATDWSDPMGHGTHVSGSIVGRGVTSNGLIKGGAHGATYFPEGMWSPLIENLTVPPKLNKLFDPAYAKGARVHSNSWGSPSNVGSYDSMASQVDDFMYSHPDFLIIFAAGNAGVDKDKNGVIDPNSIGTPGTAKNALTVGASENLVLAGGIQKQVSQITIAKDNWPAEPIWSSKLSDNENGIACFSSRGPTADNRLKPEIVAPGTNILSARSHVTGADPLWGVYNNDYVWSGGTSMATPLVAGAATVAREILIKKYNIANPSAALVKAILMNSAKDLAPGQYGAGPTQELQPRPDNNQGYGRVDMDHLSQQSLRQVVADDLKGLATGESREFSVTVTSGKKLIVNLVYTDPAATPSAGKALVNDLDLEVSGPGGQFAPHDRINNHEIVEQANLPAGTYTVKVIGQNVPMGGSQPFALIATVQ